MGPMAGRRRRRRRHADWEVKRSMRSYISKLQDRIGVQGRLPDLKSQRDRLLIVISVLALTALIALPVAAKDGGSSFEGEITGGVTQQGGGGQCDLNPSASDCQPKAPAADPCVGVTDPECGKVEEADEVVDSNGDGVSDDLENLAAVENEKRDAELGLTDDDSNGDGSPTGSRTSPRSRTTLTVMASSTASRTTTATG
jgi:hypothetical protein